MRPHPGDHGRPSRRGGTAIVLDPDHHYFGRASRRVHSGNAGLERSPRSLPAAGNPASPRASEIIGFGQQRFPSEGAPTVSGPAPIRRSRRCAEGSRRQSRGCGRVGARAAAGRQADDFSQSVVGRSVGGRGSVRCDEGLLPRSRARYSSAWQWIRRCGSPANATRSPSKGKETARHPSAPPVRSPAGGDAVRIFTVRVRKRSLDGGVFRGSEAASRARARGQQGFEGSTEHG